MAMAWAERNVHQIQQTMANTVLGDDFLRKPAHALGRSFQHHRTHLQANAEKRETRGACVANLLYVYNHHERENWRSG